MPLPVPLHPSGSEEKTANEGRLFFSQANLTAL